MPTSCSHYFREAIAGARRRGVDVEAVLAQVGLTHDQLEDPAWRGDLTLLARVVQLVVEALGDEFMGYAPARCNPGAFAMMTHCVIFEPSMEQVMRKGVLFYSFVTDEIEMSIDVDDSGGRWTVRLARPELDPAHYFLEFWLSIWFRLWGWLAGEPPALQAVEFDYTPGPGVRTELGLLFRKEPVFDAPVTSLRFDPAFLRRPVVRSRQDLKTFLADTPLGVMTPTPAELEMGQRVKSLIRVPEFGPAEFPPFSQVAAKLYLTEQTLRRRMQAENTSYRAIKQTIRRDVAERMLRETDLSVHDVSRMAGYSELRAFVRAFQDWTGMTPATFRRHQQSTGSPEASAAE
jgi:AraC-like DNA-binding protein